LRERFSDWSNSFSVGSIAGSWKVAIGRISPPKMSCVRLKKIWPTKLPPPSAVSG
jgi:hypothetical protein